MSRLASTVSIDLRTLDRLESIEGGDLPRTLDTHAFRRLTETVTRYAINRISPEWEATKVEVDLGELSYNTFTDRCTDCDLPLRFGLPCRHTLCLAYLRGDSLPKSICHPRWWIYGPAIREGEWHPTYESSKLPPSPLYRGTVNNLLTSGSLQAINIRSILRGPVAHTEYDDALAASHRELINRVRFLSEQEDQVITQMIPRNEKKRWLQEKKSHGKTTARALTGAEIAEKEANKAEKAAKKAEQSRQLVQEQDRLETQETIVVTPKVLIPGTLPLPSLPISDPITECLEEASFLPPASTAPPAIGKEQIKRTRGKTLDFVMLNGGKRPRNS